MHGLILSLFFSAFISAQSQCTDWPSLKAHGGPRLAATGMPFSNFMRFDCALGDRFHASFVEGEYANGEEKIVPVKAMSSFTLPSGEMLYQAFFSVSHQAVPGIYSFSGCVRIEDRQSGASVCFELPKRSVEIVGG